MPAVKELLDGFPDDRAAGVAFPAAVPGELAQWKLALAAEGNELIYEFDSHAEATGVPSLLRRMSDIGIAFKDLHTRQSSLEDIFVGLVHDAKPDAAEMEPSA